MTYPAPDKLPYDSWFDDKPHPHDSMPIATDDNNYASRHESTPDFEKDAEEVVTMHEKMYRMARAKYNPFAVGGSENIHDFDGGSEIIQK
tara:strand:- start:101 stop:370 length:270 start_codon:yes stop_codon:yes gene_type:complete